MNIGATGYSVGAGISKKLSNRFSVRFNAIEATVRGSDAYTMDPFRRNRNLSFRSIIHELSGMIDFHVLTVNRFGKRPNKLLAFTGIGFFAFNPQANYKGQWYDLQPLGTEGQGIISGKKKYNKTSWNIPFGIGYNVSISDNQELGFVLTMRKTFTDYIDDVSGKYYDNQKLTEQNGEMSGILADRSLQRDTGIVARPGSGRGDPRNNDNFAFIQISYSIGLSFKKGQRLFHLRSNRKDKKCFRW